MRGLTRTLALLLLGALVHHADADERADADAHARRGVALYNLGKYDDAIAEFEEAYKNFQSDALLFNLAQAHRKLEHCDRALDYYHQFLAGDPAPALATQVQKLLPELEAACRTRDARPDGPVTPTTAALETQPRQSAQSAEPTTANDSGSDSPEQGVDDRSTRAATHIGATGFVGELFSNGSAPVSGVSATAMTRLRGFPYAELGVATSVAGLWRYTSDAVVAQLAAAIEYRSELAWGRWTAAGELGAEYVSQLGVSRDVVPGASAGGAWAPLVRAELGFEHDISPLFALRAAAAFAWCPRVGALEAAVDELDLLIGVRYAP